MAAKTIICGLNLWENWAELNTSITLCTVCKHLQTQRLPQILLIFIRHVFDFYEVLSYHRQGRIPTSRDRMINIKWSALQIRCEGLKSVGPMWMRENPITIGNEPSNFPPLRELLVLMLPVVVQKWLQTNEHKSPCTYELRTEQIYLLVWSNLTITPEHKLNMRSQSYLRV